METMDKRSGAMQSRMDSNKVGCPPAFAQPREKKESRLPTVPTASTTTHQRREIITRKKRSGNGVKDAAGAAPRACSLT